MTEPQTNDSEQAAEGPSLAPKSDFIFRSSEEAAEHQTEAPDAHPEAAKAEPPANPVLTPSVPATVHSGLPLLALPASIPASAPVAMPDEDLPQFPLFQFGSVAPSRPSDAEPLSSNPAVAPAAPQTEGRERLPDYALTHFQQMLAQFEMFPACGKPPACRTDNPAALDDIRALASKFAEGRTLTWRDSDLLEIALIQTMPEATLRRQAWSLRARYFETAGAALSALYLASQPPDWEDAAVPVETLRADLETLVLETQQNRRHPPVEDPSAQNFAETSLKWTLGLLLGGVVGFLIVRLLPIPVELVPVLPLLTALLSGAVGGGFSLPARLTRAALSAGPQRERLLPILDPPSIYRYPTQGAVLAALFYILLIGGYLKGTIFPPFGLDALGTVPGGARLVAWCFLLGVLGRYLPDVPKWLRRIQARRKPAAP